MKNSTLFLKRLFVSAALGALLASPGFAMEEKNPAERAAASIRPLQSFSITSLPLELQEHIVSFVPPTDKENMRLVSHHMNMVGRHEIVFKMESVQENEARAVANFLRKHQEVRKLDIRNLNPDILNRALIYLEEGILFPNLTSLDISGSYRFNRRLDEDFFINFLKRTSTLKSLTVRGCELLALSGAIIVRNVPHLETLKLYACAIGQRQMEDIVNLQWLKEFWIVNNFGIFPQGEKVLMLGAFIANHLKGLRSLDLQGSHVGFSGVKLIAENLKKLDYFCIESGFSPEELVEIRCLLPNTRIEQGRSLSFDVPPSSTASPVPF
ncbi:MAG TPA: F-box protein [Alphaproteobacteria bacterium]|nr:MAG: hypothetical protein B7X84_05805 [Alphaproteobacteria bacterium 17-39-52]HQS85067.1 F-box protein [Alphaproteobacteria bacterium]